MEQRLEKAKQLGADVVVNGKTENLKDTGLWIIYNYNNIGYNFIIQGHITLHHSLSMSSI